MTPAFPAWPDMLRDQITQAGTLRQAITGTRPACDTRFGSSTDVCVFAGLCNDRTYRGVISNQGAGSFSNSHSPRSEGTFHVYVPETPSFVWWIEAKAKP